MLAKSASVPSLTATLASSLVAQGSIEAQEWGPEIGRSARNTGGRSPLPWGATQRPFHGSLVTQPSLASHRLEHCDSSVSRASSDWDAEGERSSVPAFRKSKSEADLTCLMTSHDSGGESSLASVREEGRFALGNGRRGGRRRSLSRSRSSLLGPSIAQERCNKTNAVRGFDMASGHGGTRALVEAGAYEEDDSLMTLVEETTMTTIGGRQMVCSARGCRPLSDEEIAGGAPGFSSGVEEYAEGGISADPQVTDAYYRKSLGEDPENALLLRNYALFLLEIQKDYPRAEEFFERAILASPSDGEVLSQYAKLIYQVHGDVERATHYHEQAVKAAPEDCYVLASFASFLWTSESSSKAQRPVFELRQEGVYHPEAPGCLIPPVA
ncbi:Tetratricopeptide repeat like superfamily protein [Klebsormidium nitens]|uniref:Tetratricopeptide repeat like superfamily protein n=1 Tax=Klebsormidium nitens TaxID=105231 RepID=A0A1Y1HP62_KLENI|nr:Tetratricopeptide repeat like superfamily protein [Klebsormidium nitens]|eukprot:GAQ78367.1 Tetratricopeptide repeat like superfamily protein [Klebsormidium nitens]